MPSLFLRLRQVHSSVDSVMEAQSELVDVEVQFEPRIVKMADDEDPPWIDDD